MKPFMILLLIIILVFGGILTFKILTPKDNRVDSSQISKEEVMQLLEKGMEQDNYIAKYEQNNEKIIKKVKGNIVIVEKEKMYIWNNLETKEKVVIDKDDKAAVITKREDGALISLPKSLPMQEDIIKLVNTTGYEFAKEDMDNGRKSILVQIKGNIDFGNSFVFTNADHLSSNSILVKAWMDVSTGVVYKMEVEAKNEEGEHSSTTQECEIELNSVREEDIKRPDLSGYQITDLE